MNMVSQIDLRGGSLFTWRWGAPRWGLAIPARVFFCLMALTGLLATWSNVLAASPFRLARFSADVTIPLNHRCMGVLPTKSQVVDDPLQAHGFVLLGPEAPIVYVAVDWCEIRNGAYDQWREALAEAAGTTRERVLVSSLHQHDAPVVDRDAARLLAEAGLRGELYDETFHDETLRRVADSLRSSLLHAVPVTHVGVGEARVEQIASSRRVRRADGSISYDRGSRSGADFAMAAAPEGDVDPTLRTLAFWNQDSPLLALSTYATHPMSRYGEGRVSSDFVGLARARRQIDLPGVAQIYASGCSGDVTAGKYNDGSDASRALLIERMQTGMRQAWEAQRKVPLQAITFRHAPLELEFHPHPDLTVESLGKVLHDASQTTEARILAAMGLASRQRVARRQPIDVVSVDLGPASLVLLPGETFVAYQRWAQTLRPDQAVLAIGYGECWPGYVPTEDDFQHGFHDKWLWVGPGSEARLQDALRQVLTHRAGQPSDSR